MNPSNEELGYLRIGTEDGQIDPAEIGDLQRALEAAEDAGNVTRANMLEALLEEWFDSHGEDEEQ
jgi:hypothetical protein